MDRTRATAGAVAGIGAGLALGRHPWGWPEAALGVAALCQLGLYLGELRFADESQRDWQGLGGPAFQWMQMWLWLGRIAAPALVMAFLFHVLLRALPLDGIRLAAYAAFGAGLSAMLWRWRHVETAVTGLAAAAMAAMVWGLRIHTALAPASVMLGLSVWVLTHADGHPQVVQQEGLKPFRRATAVMLAGGLLGALLGQWVPAHGIGVVLWLWAWWEGGRPAGAARRRLGLATVLTWALGLASTLLLALALVVWLVGQTVGALWLWLALRRTRPYMFRPYVPVMFLAGGLAMVAAAALIFWCVGMHDGIPAAGISCWFAIPPLIDAYRVGRFPFRRPEMPDPRTLPD